jgi:hypothetical protein
MVAAAWSAPGAPSSWQLTAAQFETLRHDDELPATAQRHERRTAVHREGE